jgi:restriction system protein
LRTSRVKGLLGELLLRFEAWLGLSRKDYHRFHDVMLRTPDGATQIDHVFISRFGVFVVETKHVQGWIFGNENHRRWTQVIYGNKRQFSNPLRQNYKHVKAVEQALGLDESTVHSVVVFTANTTFKTRMPPYVTQGWRFVDYIKSFCKVVFTDEQVVHLASELNRKTLSKSHILRVDHVKLLRQRSSPDAHWRCPKCGKRMVIRTASKGRQVGSQFWGCSGYPNCDYTKNIS